MKNVDDPNDSLITSLSINLSNEEFLNFLEDEINTARKDIERPGWTTWALYGAIAAIIWLLTAELNETVFEIYNILIILLIAILFYGLRVIISSLNSYPQFYDSHTHRYRFTNLFLGRNRISLFLFTFVWLLAIILSVLFSNLVSYVVTLSAILFSTIMLLISVIVFVLSFIKFPFPLKNIRRRPGSNLFILFLIALSILSIVGYCWYIISLTMSH